MADKIQNAYETSKIYMTMFLLKEIFSVGCILSCFGVVRMIMI